MQIKDEKIHPIDFNAIYISTTAGPIDTKFGPIVTHGPLMILQKFGADRPKGGAIIEAQIRSEVPLK